MLGDIWHETRFLDPLKTTVPNAAALLHFVQHTINATTAIDLQSIIPFARHIPASSGNILELHFGKNTVDFATRVNKDFDRVVLRKINHNYYNLPFINEDLLRLIKPERNGFNYGIENIWIEYDAPFLCSPAIFFDIDRSASFCPQSAYRSVQKITDSFEWQIGGRLLQFLNQIKQAGLQVVYYGLMFSRDTGSIRLTIHGIQPARLKDTLEKLAWKGNYQSLQRVTTYLKKEQKLVVGVDFKNDVEDRIGIEIFDNAPIAFLQQTLCKNQLISKEHTDLLKKWQQCLALPEYLTNSLSRLYQRPVQHLYTRINHFKFIIDSSEAIALKGYLYYCF